MKTKPAYSLVFEDGDIMVVNKAAGIPVSSSRFPGSRCSSDHRECGPIPLYKQLEAALNRKIFTVHKIDKETSGLVVFAKTAAAHRKLSLAFERREVDKTYIALVHGKPAWRETTRELGLVPDGNKKHMTIVDRWRGKKSRTRFSLLCAAGNYAALHAFPETGRTHQIRVTLAEMRHPVLCDALYGSPAPLLLSAIKHPWRGDMLEERPLISRLALHAAELRLPGWPPFKAPPPKDLKAALQQLYKNGVSYE